jgi:exonuclease VII small subunit
MELKGIVNKLELIECSLDDASNSLPEYNSNVDSRGYIDSALNELYTLKDEIEKVLSDIDKVTLDEVFNTSPYHAL